MITEDYVSFEIAKLLKEKGFDEICEYEYGVPNVDNGYVLQRFFKPIKNSELIDDAYAVPTLQMAMKWLREVHKLFIDIRTSIDLVDNLHFNYSILNMDGKYIREGYTSFEWKYEEACEAAIKYCLENLI